LKQVWRLCKQRRAPTAFSGEGARIAGGRWNYPGTSLVYTANTLSLALLEILVNVDLEDIPNDLAAISATLSGKPTTETININDLPPNWRDSPAPEATKKIGSEWAASLKSCVLAVPSSIVPWEFNYLLNPAHPDFSKIQIGEVKSFQIDQRLLKFVS